MKIEEIGLPDPEEMAIVNKLIAEQLGGKIVDSYGIMRGLSLAAVREIVDQTRSILDEAIRQADSENYLNDAADITGKEYRSLPEPALSQEAQAAESLWLTAATALEERQAGLHEEANIG